jgi:hypothetical protein
MRFLIRVDPWWWPLLLISGIFPSSPRYVALDGGVVRVRLGWLETRFPRAHVGIGAAACPRTIGRFVYNRRLTGTLPRVNGRGRYSGGRTEYAMQLIALNAMQLVVLALLGVLAASAALYLTNGALRSRRELSRGQRVRLDCFVTSHLSTREP